jgi:PAS domain S-box-containing protein
MTLPHTSGVLEERINQLLTITDCIPHLVAYVDNEQCYRFNNRAYEQWFKVTREDIYGKHIRTVLGEPAYQVVREYVETALAGTTVSYERLLPYTSGARWTRATYTPDVAPNGTVRGLVAVVSDITEVKQLENTRNVVTEQMPQIVWVSSKSGSINYMNQRWYEFTGFDRNLTDISSGWERALHSDDLPDVLRTWTESLTHSTQWECEYRMRRQDGEYRWFLGRCQPVINDRGEITEWLGTATDIHDKRRAEDQLRFMAEATHILFASLDYETTLRNVAELMVPKLADWFRIDLVDKNTNFQHLTLLHRNPEMMELGLEVNRRLNSDPSESPVMKTGESQLTPVITDEMLVAGLGHDEWLLNAYRKLNLTSSLSVALKSRGRILGSLALVYSESGRHYTQDDVKMAEELARYIAVAVDNAQLFYAAQQEISERANAQQALLQAQAEVSALNSELERKIADLRGLNNELGTFTYIISHDLRAPLVNLKGFTAELSIAVDELSAQIANPDAKIDLKALHASLEGNIREALNFINSAVSRMDRLTNAVLKLSRLGRRELTLENVEMTALVQNIVDSLAYQIKQHNVAVTIQRLPTVRADRIALEQIMGNILSNAVLYLRNDCDGRIEVWGERGERETTYHVKDNGRGIAKGDFHKVFEPFRRAGRDNVPGEGMGLAYVQTLVRRHGGRIWFDSEVNVGTTFSFTIPHDPKPES